MLYAVNGNKQLKIDEADKAAYLKLGYDIAEENGGVLETIETSPAKTVTYAEHKKALDRIEELEAQLSGTGDEAAKEIASLKAKLAEANKKLKEVTGT
ncbi:conserved hypothetical protein [Paenibacillus curdlanolyticus YK9]|uniref:Uncharacterized protein n=1 Tax=Paenibacillus curdlanolyticus YK9 TaxID=717606 RepID=E0IBT5_9BACL|nr:hypothetical protein [Paenibacillus curdlanolyticus]EFM10165.1 conserved hypothetical protein [Paenibacillus curdlanolyticus YK9]